MITIKDIAKLAGVSHGTVSNVLNGRGNVSLKKIMLVENAAKQLGYSINERGQQLRNPVQLQVGVVLPNIRDERYSIVYSTLSSYLRDHGGSCTLYLTDDIPNREEDALNEIAGRRLPCVVLVSCQPEGSEARTLRKSKIAGQIGYASVSGGKPLMGGGVLGVASSSKKKEAALEFIRWACSERISLPFTLLGGISPCKKVYANTELLELFPWLSIVPSNYKNAVMRRVPVGMDEYAVERCIGLAVKSALSGVISPEDALRNAQLQLEKMIVK